MNRCLCTSMIGCIVCVLVSRAMAYGPAVLYTPPDGAPARGCLYARAVQLKYSGPQNGRMYATFEQYTWQTPVFPIYESTDNGEHWKQVGSVSDQKNGWGMKYQPFLYELPQRIGSMTAGTLLCAGNSIPPDGSQTKLDLYKSTDFGRTWEFVSSIARGGAARVRQGDPVWEPFLMVANDKLICYYSDERDPDHSQKLVHQVSIEGRRWGPVVDDVALPDRGKRPGMPVVARMGNAHYIMVYEIVGARGCYFQTSPDPEKWDVANMGTRFADGGSPYVVVQSDGAVVASSSSGKFLHRNTENGSGIWTAVPASLAGGYTRCLVPLANGRLFLIHGGHIGGGPNAEKNTVWFADMQQP